MGKYDKNRDGGIDFGEFEQEIVPHSPEKGF